jgi:hypothetical protein
MVAIFANGTCGNINHINYLAEQPQLTGPPETHRLGAALADAVMQTWPRLQPVTTVAPRVRSAMVTVPRPKFSEAEVAKAQGIASRMMTENLGTVVMAEAVCILETVRKQDTPLQVEVQAFALSDDLAVVSLPGEIFVELGLAIKAASPFKQTLIAELANGSMGYVPNREAYPQGNYEVVSARGEAGTGELLVSTALQLLQELKSEK